MEAASAPTVEAVIAVDVAARVAAEASSTIAMDVASAVEAAPALEASAATNAAAVKGVSATEAACGAAEPAPVEAMAAGGEKTAIAPRVSPEARVRMEPRTGSDEESTGEPLRAIVTIRCACIRGVVIVAVGANRGYTLIYRRGVVSAVHWANSYPDRNLRTRQRSGNQANSS